jgi:hypothetical protein
MDHPDSSLPSPAPPPAYALRLTFDYQGTALRLADSRRVEMRVPPVVAPAPKPGQSGYWIQVTDAAGRIVYHRSLHNPIAVDIESYTPDRSQTITRVPLPAIEGQFTALIPDLPAAQAFALHGPPDPRSPSTPAQELLRLDVDALRKFRPKPRGGPSDRGTAQGT